MKKGHTKERKRKKNLSRRDFIKTSAGAGTAAIVGAAAIKNVTPAESIALTETAGGSAGALKAEATRIPSLHVGFPIGDRNFVLHPSELGAAASGPGVARNGILFALGDTLIPSAPADPGYRDLEWHGITDEVSRRIEIKDEDLEFFDRACIDALGGRFTALNENQRADFLYRIIRGEGSSDQASQQKLREVYSHVREMVFTVYYQNFPEQSWPRDALRAPLVKPGDAHQITNPNTTNVFTGWDLAGYAGPLTWEEEERRRTYFKKIKWQE
ncbi:MAG: twin-arginine translocation signal domain-containing protein [Acidobacteria bacterium]|nr:twin-arginine translocation signal domain-containing protein [Acidobacteriota bacterium]